MLLQLMGTSMQMYAPQPGTPDPVVYARRGMQSNEHNDQINGCPELCLDGRILLRRSDIRKYEQLVNKVHKNLYMKLTFMLVYCRHRARVLQPQIAYRHRKYAIIQSMP